MVASMSMTVVALSEIADHFGVTLGSVSWVVIVQGLVITALMMPMGRLGDIIGRKKIHMAGLFIFATGTVITALSPSFGLLIGAQIVAAIGNSMLQSVGTAIILSVFPPTDRGKVLGTQTTMVAIGMAAGPIVAGIILQFLPWQSIFLVLLIPITVAIVLGFTVLDEKRVSRGMATDKPPFDFVGAIVSALVVVLVVLLINNPFRIAVVSPLIIGGALFAVILSAYFVWWELHTESPMLELRMFKNRVLSMASTARLFGFIGAAAFFLLMPIYLISIRGFEEAFAGAVLFLSPVGLALSAQISGRLGDKFGMTLFMTVGFGSFLFTALALAFISADSPVWILMVILFVNGVGLGTWNVSSNSMVMGAAPKGAMGVVSALTNLTRNVGSVVGQAIMTSVVVGVMLSRGFDIPLSEVADNPDATLAYMAGWRVAFLLVAVFALIGLIAALTTRLREEITRDKVAPTQVPQK
jgi:MFS family permease